MKIHNLIAILASACGVLDAADVVTYTNYLRQFHVPSGVDWDASSTVEPSGSRLSDLAINPGGARFELWTFKSPIASAAELPTIPLASAYVGTYVPLATVTIRSEDPYDVLPRTRVDRPFYVDLTVGGLLSGASDPEASKSVKLLRYAQSYGVGGNGINIDPSQALMISSRSITTNGPLTVTVPGWGTAVPGSDPLKIRGEERFSVFTLADNRTSGGLTYAVPEISLAEKKIQIWPMADASCSGISQNQVIRFDLPQLTITLGDLYPGSNTYAQVYPGTERLGVTGKVVPGSAWVNTTEVPASPPMAPITDYDSVFDGDGTYTMELITETPFGVERLEAFGPGKYSVTFTLERSIQVNGSFTTIE